MSEELKKDPFFSKNYIEADQFHALQSENLQLKEMLERMVATVEKIELSFETDGLADEALAEYQKWKESK